MKDGKKQSKKYFDASVKTDKDWKNINEALRRYKNHLFFNRWKNPKNGPTFFNNWEDWIKEPITESDTVIITSSYDVKIPEVIVLSTYDKVYRKDVRLTKRNVYIRDGYKCQYTGKTK